MCNIYNILLQSLVCLTFFLLVSFYEQKFFILIKCNLPFLKIIIPVYPAYKIFAYPVILLYYLLEAL